MSGQELDSPECFFTRSGSIFGCPDIGAVNAPQVEVDKPFFIEIQLQRFKDGIDTTCTLPTSKGVVDRAPWAETFWQISPRCTGVKYPENAIEHLAWLASRASAYAVMWKQGLDKPPLYIGQLIATGHCIDLKLLRRCEIISSSL